LFRCLLFAFLICETNFTFAKPSDESFAKYRRALRSGRKLESKGDLAGAAAAFTEALAARPDDGVATSELGWVAFQQKDLDKADKLIVKAIAVLDEPHQLGAAFYNLGRVHEARGNRDAAVTAYKTSLEKRPNHVVRDRLAKLDPDAAAAADPARPTPMAGPFKSEDEACKKLVEKGDPEPCTTLQELEAPAAPWKTAKLVKHGDLEELALLVKTAGGWFSSGDLATCSYEQMRQRCDVGAFELANLLDGPTPELKLAFTESMEYRDEVTSDEGETLHPLVSDDQHYLMACGVGASGKPSCSGLLTVGVTAAGGAELPRMDFMFDAQFSGDQVEIKPKKGKAAGDYKDVLGTHRMIFP
jgi:tetratricopeptide (TPR) repeat protein